MKDENYTILFLQRSMVKILTRCNASLKLEEVGFHFSAVDTLLHSDSVPFLVWQKTVFTAQIYSDCGRILNESGIREECTSGTNKQDEVTATAFLRGVIEILSCTPLGQRHLSFLYFCSVCGAQKWLQVTPSGGCISHEWIFDDSLRLTNIQKMANTFGLFFLYTNLIKLHDVQIQIYSQFRLLRLTENMNNSTSLHDL